MKDIYNISYSSKHKLDIYLPNNKNFKTIICFHGGGFVEGEKGWCYDLGHHFAAKGFCLVSPDYSLYPNAKFPDYLEDAALAIKYVFDHIKEYGGNGEIYIAGNSAGAWLTLMLCFNEDYLLKVGIKNTQIKGWISESAQPTSHFNIGKIEESLEDKEFVINKYAPLFYLNKNTPHASLLALAYTDDIKNRLNQNLKMVEMINSEFKQIKITFRECSGTHCYGSSKTNENGEFDFVNQVIGWIRNNEND